MHEEDEEMEVDMHQDEEEPEHVQSQLNSNKKIRLATDTLDAGAPLRVQDKIQLSRADYLMVKNEPFSAAKIRNASGCEGDER